jgi:hypothetical protein
LVAKASREGEALALGLGANQSKEGSESGSNSDWFATAGALPLADRSPAASAAHPPSVML